eukprot:PhM_4_TR13367/c3_g1_i3/m.64912
MPSGEGIALPHLARRRDEYDDAWGILPGTQEFRGRAPPPRHLCGEGQVLSNESAGALWFRAAEPTVLWGRGSTLGAFGRDDVVSRTGPGTVPSAPRAALDDSDFVFAEKHENPNELFDRTVQRETMYEQGVAEFSQLQNVVKEPRYGVPEPRSNSRKFDETKVTSGEKESRLAESSASIGELPYDDDRMAEIVLEMEVEGQIDETWADAKTAYIDDVESVCKILKDNNVLDLVVICTKEKTYTFDYVVFGTCHGPRHMNIVGWAIQETDRYVNLAKTAKGVRDTEWEAIPCGRIIVNLMTDEYRKSVNFERKWALTSTCDPMAAAHSAVSDGRGINSHGLWTLTLNLQDLSDFENDYCREYLLQQF